MFYHSFNEQAYKTVDVIAEYAGIDHHQVMKVIRDHKTDLEEFGVLDFKSPKPQKGSKGGRPRKDWHWNERQVTFLFSLLDNTPKVVAFLKALTKAFFEAKEKLHELEIENIRKEERLNDLTKVNKSLADVIKERFPEWSYAYSSINDLALKKVTGLDAKHLKDKFNVGDAKDALTAEQVEQLEKFREAIKSLLLIGFDYNQLKATMAA